MKIDPKILADARARVDGCPSELPLVAEGATVAAFVVVFGIVACAAILVVSYFCGGVA